SSSFFFFFNDTATTEIYTLSLHDALPIFAPFRSARTPIRLRACCLRARWPSLATAGPAPSASKQPTRAYSGFHARSITIQPAAPETPCAPEINLPSEINPAPMPVPTVTKTRLRTPLRAPAPSHASARACILRSPSINVGRCRTFSSSDVSGVFDHPGRFGAHTVWVRGSNAPGTPTPTAAILGQGTLAALTATWATSNSAAKSFLTPLVGVGSRTSDRTSPRELTTPPAILVPPRSKPSVNWLVIAYPIC